MAADSLVYHLFTLGSFRLEFSDGSGDVVRTLRPGKPLALLTFLAFAPRRTATRDQLCDLIWGDKDIEPARAQLRNALWSLRSQLGESFIVSTPQALSLAGSLDIDAITLSTAIDSADLARAVDSYGGDFLSSYASTGAERFEEWAAVERIRFRMLYVRALESGSRSALDAGRFADAFRYARLVREHDVHGEVGWRLVLESLLAGGNRIDALAECDKFDEWLRLEDRTPEPASAAMMRMARRSEAATPASASSASLSAELVAREAEFSTLHQLWSRAKLGDTRHVHISAESGLGKTRLVQDFIRRLKAGRERAVYLKANSTERAIPFCLAATFAQSLARLTGASGVAPGIASTLVALNPSLTSTYSAAREDNLALTPLRAGIAIRELAAAVADEAPLVIVIDDLQWSDQASSDALGLMVSQLTGARILFITTGRPQALRLTNDAEVVRLVPLSAPATEQMISSIARLPAEPWAIELPARLHSATNGNPLMLLDLLRLTIQRGLLSRQDGFWQCNDTTALYASLERKHAIRDRLQEMEEGERRIIEVLAIAGMSLPIAFLSKLSGRSAEFSARSLSHLEDSGLIAIHDDQCEVAHDAIAEAASEDVDSSVRAQTHATLGRIMAEDPEEKWNRQAIQQLAKARLWDEAVTLALARINSERKKGNLEGSLVALLGPEATEDAVRELKRRMPLRVRRPLAVRAGAAASIMAIFASTMLLAGKAKQSSTDRPALGILAPDGSGGTRLWRVLLSRERWEPGSALAVTGSGERWNVVFGQHMLGRPDSKDWARDVVYPDSGEGEIQLLRPSGEVIRLTHARGQDRLGTFSPDGKQLAFATTRWSDEGFSNIAVLDLGSREVRRITGGSGTHEGPRWSPDGTRLSYMRRTLTPQVEAVCVVNVDGTGNRCSTWEKSQRSIIGWVDADRLLLDDRSGSDSARAMLLDLASGQLRNAFIDGQAMDIDPTGKWVLVQAGTPSGIQWRVEPLGQPGSGRVIAVPEGRRQVLLLFTAAQDAGSYIDRLGIEIPGDSVIAGVPHQLIARAFTKAGEGESARALRWRSLTPAIATVDSLGVVTGHAAGTARIELSAGGWRVSQRAVPIRYSVADTLLHERWDEGSFTRWRPFGDPRPQVQIGTAALLINGDDNFFSGVYRQDLRSTSGLAADIPIAIPISADRWQVIHAILGEVTRPSALAAWNSRSGYIADFLSASYCSLSFPQGEGADATERPFWMADLRRAAANPRLQLGDGNWHTLRLQIFPDGRCGVAIDGYALVIGALPARISGPVTLILQGSSFGTQVRVGPVMLRSGVPPDLNWQQLVFEGTHWRTPRARPSTADPLQ